jgi:preprotein translocase subunit SecF
MTVVSKLRSCLSDNNIDFMKVHKIALILSVISIILSITLIFTKGLNFGIDFSGGVLIEARIKDANINSSISKIRTLIDQEIKDVQIQNIGQNDISDTTSSDLLIRVPKSKNEDQTLVIKRIQEILSVNYSDIQYRKIDYVGPQVGAELIKKGTLSLLLSFIFIMIYIWIRFDWQFGVGGIFALLHDAITTLGIYSITNLEFNLTSIAALLTIIGYSINDSVVIYDRIRENIRHYKKTNLNSLINSSINSTLSRTVITSSITLFLLLALILFGGEVLKSFSIATFFGILIGTYSSIYISAPILLYFDPRKAQKS